MAVKKRSTRRQPAERTARRLKGSSGRMTRKVAFELEGPTEQMRSAFSSFSVFPALKGQKIADGSSDVSVRQNKRWYREMIALCFSHWGEAEAFLLAHGP